MTYKCKNCGQIYNTKQEYCDCGNNTFTEIIESINEHNSDKNSTETIQTQNNNDLQINYNNYQKEENNKNSASNTAFFLFILFIIIFLILLFIIIIKINSKINKNVSVQTQNTIEKKQEQVTTINKIEAPYIEIINESYEQKDTKEQTKTITPQNKNTNNKNIQKTNKENQKIPTSQKIKVNKQDNTNSVFKNNQTSTKENNNTSQNLNTEKSKTNPLEEKITKNTNNINELNEYKVQIRKSLFSNFPILNVQGKGSSQIAFSIASDGKLLNRKFVSKSDNKSLNDAMYHMLMRTPYIKNPPQAYSGEEFILQMDFDNGKYSFSYVQ